MDIQSVLKSSFMSISICLILGWISYNNQEYQTYLTAMKIHLEDHLSWAVLMKLRKKKKIGRNNKDALLLTWCVEIRGFRFASFLAAASIEIAALLSSVSAITIGSSGSSQSDPGIIIIKKIHCNSFYFISIKEITFIPILWQTCFIANV